VSGMGWSWRWIRVGAAMGLAATLLAGLTVRIDAHADTVNEQDGVSSCPADGSTWSGSNPWCYSWQTDHDWMQANGLAVPSPADGAAVTLAGTEFRPAAVTGGERFPAVAILHGLGGKKESMWWLGRYLAGRGYVVVTVTTNGNSAANFDNAMQAMVDYLRSPTNPYAAYIDVTRIGAAGHSAGARAASWIQDADWWTDSTQTEVKPDHVKAVVALDNLTSDHQGDSGTYLLAPQCTLSTVAGRPVYTSGINSVPITPRVPALGLASDDNAVTCPERNVIADPDAKEAAWSKWRDLGIEAMELVVRGTNHLSFDQDISRAATGDAHLELIGQLTRAWFDHSLSAESSALGELVGADLFGQPRPAQLSAEFHSGAFIPELGLTCAHFEDVTTCPPVAATAIARSSHTRARRSHDS
jgi:hypothetical protein